MEIRYCRQCGKLAQNVGFGLCLQCARDNRKEASYISFHGHPLGDNGNFFHCLLFIPSYILYIRPRRNGSKGSFWRYVSRRLANMTEWN